MGKKAYTRNLRVAGNVQPGSIERSGPDADFTLLELGKTGALSPIFVLAFIVGAVVIIGFVVFMERAQRRIIIQYPTRQVGQRVFGFESCQMPL